VLHLIPDDDGLPHAPTTECGCDPRPGQWRGRTAMFHVSPDPDDDFPTTQLREVPGHDDNHR
jgi:hypothetical protein